MSAVREFGGKFRVAGELLVFLWQNKLWWTFPMVSVLLVIGILIVVGTTSGVSPFTYTLL